VLGDFNGDGKTDVAILCADGLQISIPLGNGDGTFRTLVVTSIANPGALELELAPNRPNQSLYEGMRKWHVRNRLDFRNLEYPKIGLPLVESIQRIMIRAEVFWQTMPANRSMKHPLHQRCHCGRQTRLPDA
jgi:hypothetical protein